MSDKNFIDTNILVYSVDSNDLEKQLIAKTLLQKLAREKSGVISTQMLQEFFNIATKKLKFTKEDAKKIADTFRNSFEVKEISVKTVFKGFDVSINTQFSLWDSLALATASEYNCKYFYSEDLNNGQIVQSVEIVNPFIIKK